MDKVITGFSAGFLEVTEIPCNVRACQQFYRLASSVVLRGVLSVNYAIALSWLQDFQYSVPYQIARSDSCRYNSGHASLEKELLGHVAPRSIPPLYAFFFTGRDLSPVW